MTKIDIVSGFLGAGKTTLIQKLLKEALKGSRVVLIENEFGEIGIDGGFLKDAGIEIKEMNSGCICCSLVGDFGASLKEVLEKYEPDRILIEPSGVGRLSDVMKAVQGVEGEAGAALNSAVAVVDASKCKLYCKNFGEFFIDQISHAGTVILSRTGSISEEKLRAAVELIREHNAKASLITTPWEQLEGSAILAEIEGAADLEAELMAQVREEAGHDCHHGQEDACGHRHVHGEEEHGHPHVHGEEEHGHPHVHGEEEHGHSHVHGEEEHGHSHVHGEREHGHPHVHGEEEHGHSHVHEEEEHGHPHVHGEEEHGHSHVHEEEEHGHPHVHGEEEHGHSHVHEEEEHGHSHAHSGEGHGHRHEHHGHHHADEVFTSWGIETPAIYTKEEIEAILQRLGDEEQYGLVLRAKGMVPSGGRDWIYFDYVPEEARVRDGNPDVTGKICVIGAKLQEAALQELFRKQ